MATWGWRAWQQKRPAPGFRGPICAKNILSQELETLKNKVNWKLSKGKLERLTKHSVESAWLSMMS
jgi:hypothetical protein